MLKKLLIRQDIVLNDNGFILFSEPAFDILSGMHSNTVQEKRRFNKRQLESYLKNAGYKNMIISR